MKNYNFVFILIFIFIVFLISVYFNNTKKNKLFYEIDEINPQLKKINKIKNKILKETENVYKKKNL